jgi:hypothetical protein
MIIAHVLNPVKVNESNPSYLYYTQPVSFDSMYVSKKYAEENHDSWKINLYSVHYPEDNVIVPNYFIKLPYLTRSIKDKYPDISKKKLPFVQDIFDSMLKYIKADYYIFTNSDIILNEKCYDFIIKKIIRYNYEALIINRRDNIPKMINNIRLGSEHLNLINILDGERHMGKDFFVMKKNILEKINMKDVFIAHPPWGGLLTKYLRSLTNQFKLFGFEYFTYHLGNDNNHGNSNTKNELTIINTENAKIVEDLHL